MTTGIEIGLSEVLIGAGVVVILLGAAKRLTIPTAAVLAILLIGSGAVLGGYVDISGISDTQSTTETPSPVQDKYIFYDEGITGIATLCDYEAKTPIQSKTLELYEKGTDVQAILARTVSPLMISSATDANGDAKFRGLLPGDYVVAFKGDETAFDGSHYMTTVMPVKLDKVRMDLQTKETYFVSQYLYVKKIGDVSMTITASSGSNDSSEVDADVAITESGTSGTTVKWTLECETDKAWLTDSTYACRFYLYDTWTDNGGDNTDISLADCRINSSTGSDILTDGSGNYYVEVTGTIMKNVSTNVNFAVTITIWCPDLGTVDTTADTFKLTGRYAFQRLNSTSFILRDAGNSVTITQEGT